MKITDKIINSLEFFLLTLVVINFLGDFISISVSLMENLYNLISLNVSDSLVNMTGENNPVVPTTQGHNTENSILHDDGNWSTTIRTLFIYGSGVLRMSLIRNPSPLARGFIIGTSLLADGASRVAVNIINDPTYIHLHAQQWKLIWANVNRDEAEVHLDAKTDSVLASASENTDLKNFIGDGFNLEELSNNILSHIMDGFYIVLSPVKVNYSNELLANQINDLSIFLFLLSISIIVLFLAFIFNVIIFLNSDKIMNYFENKFIRMYVLLNKKIISIELFFLSGSILYFLYVLSSGIRFIATHPIIFS
jgi:hypothetical protein